MHSRTASRGDDAEIAHVLAVPSGVAAGRARWLVVVRHAKSSWDDAALADHDRPLAPRGRKALRRMADHLRDAGVAPDLVLCSSALRARQTLDGLRPALGEPAGTRVEPALYGAGAGALVNRLRQVDDGVTCVVLVGHNPGVADLVELLDRAHDVTDDALPTGAIAVLDVEVPWRSLDHGEATLLTLWTPRQGLVVDRSS
jgi:phosphohistidine phosphatase